VKSIIRKSKQLLSVIKPHARYYVEFIIGIVLVAQGMIAIFPGEQLPGQTTFSILTTHQVELILAVWQIASGLLLIIGVSSKPSKREHALRRSGAFGGFLSLTFLTFLGILSSEVNDLFWIATTGLALVSGIIYIRMGWDQ
jgi:hypothetical protein